MKSAKLAIVVLVATSSANATASAQTATADPGQKEYEARCSICHGLDAKGSGVFSQALKVAPPDLTLLARNNGGVFPAERISGVIDGRIGIVSHGPRDMPIWGARYAGDAAKRFPDIPYAQETYIRARVLQLVEYLSRIQQK
ncbi:MAG: cytochrome c [Bradyrhizobium sp.]|nr:cytochrome c [Bradyrhizobium sp.]